MDLRIALTNLDGEALMASEDEALTACGACTAVLLSPAVKGGDVVRRGLLAQRIYNLSASGADVPLEANDVAFILEHVPNVFSPIVCLRLTQVLDPQKARNMEKSIMGGTTVESPQDVDGAV